jgi:hypothetical protein
LSFVIVLEYSFQLWSFRKKWSSAIRRLATLVACVVALSATAHGQSIPIEQVRVVSGTVLSFHLQTRINPDAGDSLDALPKGTVLHVRMLDSIDSTVDRDGSQFRGSIVSPLISGDRVVVHSEAEVHGLLALLRSRSHPEGFRYELLITGVVDHGKSYTLTASLDPSYLDPSKKPNSPQTAETKNSLPTDGLSSNKEPDINPR